MDEGTLPPRVMNGAETPQARPRGIPKPLRRALFIAFYAALAIVCFLTIKHQLGPGGFQSVLASLRLIAPGNVAASLGCILGVYATLWAMEQAALNRIHAPRATHMRPVSALAANAVSLGSGFGMLSGGALRARLYAPAGLDTAGAFYVASAVTLMSLLGGATIASLGLVFSQNDIIAGAHWRWLGFAGLGGMGVLVALAGAQGRSFTLFGRRINLPGAAELIVWIAFGAVDWLFSAGALYALLPDRDGIPFETFAPLFAISHFIAMPTGAPGGLGVFDALMLSAASGAAPAGHLAAALIVHRAIAFLAPVCIGLFAIAVLETRNARAAAPQRTQSDVGRLMHALLQVLIGAPWRAHSGAPVTKGSLFEQGTISPTPLSALTGDGPILILAPHPDDEVLGCGGLIAMAVARGVDVHILYLTDGRRSHLGSRHWSTQRLIATRREEATRAAHVLGVAAANLTFLPNHDGALLFNPAAKRRTKAALVELVQRQCITRIFAPWIHDPHPDHVAAALLARAFARQNASVKLISYPVYGRLLPDPTVLRDRPWQAARLDVHEGLAVKRAALSEHRSQVGHLIDDALLVFPAPNHGQRDFFTDYELFFQ